VALVVDRFGLGDGSLGVFDGLGGVDGFGGGDGFGGVDGFGGARRLPVSALKLDRGVVARVTDDDATRRLVAAVVAAARGAGVDVIALGVEEQAQAELLTELGLTAATGYLFSEAVPAASIAELLLITS